MVGVFGYVIRMNRVNWSFRYVEVSVSMDLKAESVV